ncbi:MAG: TonB-dependent receptor [Flavobacterium sp.]|nr:TonB-dependent receptor [Flavobacterium sp.]
MQKFSIICFVLISFGIFAQETTSIKGRVMHRNQGVSGARIEIFQIDPVTADSLGFFSLRVSKTSHQLTITASGYKPMVHHLGENLLEKPILIELDAEPNSLDEVVISGTMRAVRRGESAVPVEVYSPAYFKKNPTSNVFEALQNLNGVRPQLNCNVCNTGDIHINGLEGPYTLVMIDGMPIVSGLSTVYGLSGIPNSLIERIEIVKGPASSLYGSEAVGGLINIITRKPGQAPRFAINGFSTDWGEASVDIGLKTNIGKQVSLLSGLDYFNFSNPIDTNNDNFTDVTLQHRIFVFQKLNFDRASGKLFTIAGRFFYEDRWGGEMQWNKSDRGGDTIYGESIYTNRWEILTAYDLPTRENMSVSLSFTDHDQNSVYGNTRFLARQRIGFAQLVWDKPISKHNLLFGAAVRFQSYNDNTPATANTDETWIPGIFVQNEIKFDDKHNMLLGARLDHNNHHGPIVTPRFAYKFNLTPNDIFRFNVGTGFRVVNLFTEEHAALTGSREVVIQETLKPEKSYNANLNYLKKIFGESGNFVNIEASAWYTYFTNSIIPDYDSNPNQIIYKNLDGFSVSRGISANLDASYNRLKINLGATFMDVAKKESGNWTRQMLTEKFSATWAISYGLPKLHFNIDYTGNLYGPMRLPLLGPLDPRSPYSPTWSIQNIQFTFTKIKDIEIYFGVKNLLNWTPNKNNPFIIARAHDPFDQNVETDASGNVIATPDNPYALTFDPSYVYGPNQGIRTFGGLRYHLN